MSWEPVNLADVLSGTAVECPPAMLYTVDGPALLYDGKDHSAYGEPESGKSWLGTYAAAERIRRNEHSVYLDFEDDAPAFVARMRALGVDDEQLLAFAHYVRPEEPLSDASWVELEHALRSSPLAVIDGFNLALSLHGLDSTSNADVARFSQLFVRGLHRYGELATLTIDHVTKNREDRGRYAIGAQQKLGGVDVAFSLHVLQPFGRGRDGTVAIKLRKDRPGHLRAHQGADGEIARMQVHSSPNGRVRIELRAVEAEGASAAGFRPTVLMERVSRAIEENPGLGKRALREAVSGQNGAKDLALELLKAEGFVEVDPGASGHQHRSIRPFRTDSDNGAHPSGVPGSDLEERAPRAPACPSGAPGVPGGQNGNRAPVPPPLQGGARGTVPSATPDEEATAARLLAVSLTDEEPL